MDYTHLMEELKGLEKEYQGLKKDLSREEKRCVKKQLYRIDPPGDHQIYVLSFFFALTVIAVLFLPYLYYRLRGFTYGFTQLQLIEIDNLVGASAKLSFYQNQFFKAMDVLNTILQSFVFIAISTVCLWIVFILRLKRFYHAL